MDKFASEHQMLYLTLTGSVRRKPPGVKSSYRNAIQRKKELACSYRLAELSRSEA
jgi:hypothetical protein